MTTTRKMQMNKIIKILVAACCAVLGLSAGATNVGEPVTWSNFGTSKTINKAGSQQFKFCYQPQEGLAANSKVTLTEIVIANRDGEVVLYI